MICESYEVIETIKEKYKNSQLAFEFSIHDFTFAGMEGREILNVEKELLTKSWLEEQISGKEDKELSLHCWVTKDKSNYFIPMIDFICKSKPNLKDLLPLHYDFQIYSSGNSYHGYSPVLVPAKEWHSYMGDLLLLNMPNKEGIVDSRWAGHSFINGFCALRLTSNLKSEITRVTMEDK
jgi:hypothetical protein